MTFRPWYFAQLLTLSLIYVYIFSYFTVSNTLSGGEIGELNSEKYEILCRNLNVELISKDWKTLAGRMQYSIDEVKMFAQNSNPTDTLLRAWGTAKRNDISRLIELLRGMQRDDLVKLLES